MSDQSEQSATSPTDTGSAPPAPSAPSAASAPSQPPATEEFAGAPASQLEGNDDAVSSPSDGSDTIGADQPGLASDTVKDPSDWVSGDEPMTGAQRSYLDTLARRAGEQLPAELTKAEASEHIDRLQGATGTPSAAGDGS